MPPKRSHLSSTTTTTTTTVHRNQSNAKTVFKMNYNRYSTTERGRSLVERPPNLHSSPLLRPIPFDKLPVELVHDIFTLSCLEVVLDLKDTIVPFPFKLGLVCKKWRAIVAAHRSLWAAFAISARGDWDPKFGAHLRHYLHQSGSHPLTIRVWPVYSDEVIFNILDAIMAHCERWAMIKLYFPLEYRFLKKLEAVRDRLPLLQRLSIMGPRERYPIGVGAQHCTIFRNVPSLNRVAVNKIDTDSDSVLSLPWNHVSRASLDPISFRKIQSSLELSQSLTALTLTEVFYPALLRAPATLKKLQVLRVRDKIHVGYLTCPSLKRLEVYNENVSAIRKLLNNSSCSLVHLKIRGLGAGSLSHIIRHSSLASLTFLSLDQDCIPNGAMDILILGSQRLLPLLEIMCIDVDFDLDSKETNNNFKSQIRSLRWIVESRTYDRHGREGSLSYFNSTTKHKAVVPLKECHFTFTVYQRRWKKWQDRALQCLESFCDSRNVRAVLTRSGAPHVQDNRPCDKHRCYHIPDGDSNNSDEGNSDDNDYI